MLDVKTKEQLTPYIEYIENNVVLGIGSGDNARKMRAFAEEVAAMSPKISVKEVDLEKENSLSIDRVGEKSGIVFAGLPLGHEFSSFVLALIQVSGRKPKIDDSLIEKIKTIDEKLNFTVYVSLSCHNCPEVVQALNILAVLNPNITTTTIDGSGFQKEAEAKGVTTVPTIFLNDEEFGSGRLTLEKIMSKLDLTTDSENVARLNAKEVYDLLVVGGGPAAYAAAIYSVRKGIKTGLVADFIGGQVLDTLGIENIICQKYVEGPKFVETAKEHLKEYPIDLILEQMVVNIEKKELFHLHLEIGAVLKSKTVVAATGARWRNIDVPGEKVFKNKGVAYCPHCDGPLYAGKKVAVIGGGNSGVEAAIDLAGICDHVTLLEFMPQLKADNVLQVKLKSLPNVTILTNVETKEITGTNKVEAMRYADRATGGEFTLPVAGVFILIGLVPNTEWLTITEKNKLGEIITNKRGESSVSGLFAAGDCTDTPYKQIIISMGSGATAALGAFDYLIRN